MGRDLSGVGVYSRELLHALALLRPDIEWEWLYRPHRFLKSRSAPTPRNAAQGLLLDRPLYRSPRLFHGLNQRLPKKRFTHQIATFHDLFVMTADYSTPEFRARFTAQAKHAASESDQIIAVSQFTANQVTTLLDVDPSRITVIPHGVRSIQLPALRRENLILHVGAIQKRKNLVRLVRAFEAVPADWKLVLAGSDGFGAEAVHAAIAQSSASGRITVTGYVGEQELANWYALAMIFAFPSLDEGFGMPVLEAMTAGIPVLSSNGSALNEIAGDAAILVNPLDQEQLREALLKLCHDASLRNQLIDKGRWHASQYTWQRAAAATLQAYRRFTLLP